VKLLFNGFSIVTKDEDCDNMAALCGSPPKVIWLQLGNCSTDDVGTALRTRFSDIQAFEREASANTLIVS
jgi:predicted nuclease of predicted toxin-antitoxin system